MPLYIRDSTVDDLAEKVRARTGAATKTDAVRLALMHELERHEQSIPLRDKLAALQQRAQERLGLPVVGVDMKKMMDDLWEEGDVR